MSRVRLFIFSIFLVSFVFCAFGALSYAQIGPGGDMPSNGPDTPGPGGDMPGAGGDTPVNGPDTPGPGGDRPTDGDPFGSNRMFSDKAEGPSSGLLTLTPLVAIGPIVHFYEVFNATPGGEIYIISGVERGTQNNLICPDLTFDLILLRVEDILIANEFGYVNAEIGVLGGPGGFGTYYMQAIDIESCRKSNRTEYDI